MSTVILRNAEILDTETMSFASGDIVIVDGIIRETGAKNARFGDATTIDLKGTTLLPGLIDCHVHVVATEPSFAANSMLPNSLVAARAASVMKGMLMRGFTTVRDAGGADRGLTQAVDEGHIVGPRLITCGKALSQTGGHADFRSTYDNRDGAFYADRLGCIGRICDGVAEVRKACRDEIKMGASFIKIMASGGIASTHDPIHFLGFSSDEIAAAVEEASNASTYVAAHLYTDRAIRRAVELGVKSIEHCTFVTPETARLMRERGAVACPTIVTLEKIKKHGRDFGIAQWQIDKGEATRRNYYETLETLKQEGVSTVFGTDIVVGELHQYQSEEFVLRREVLPAADVLASATTEAAALLGMTGAIGSTRPGAFADLIAVRGNPLEDISVLARQDECLAMVMKSGKVAASRL